MKKLKEFAYLKKNSTGAHQNNNAYFVQIDNTYAIDQEGTIFKIVNEDVGRLVYCGQSGTLYNYAEDYEIISQCNNDKCNSDKRAKHLIACVLNTLKTENNAEMAAFLKTLSRMYKIK